MIAHRKKIVYKTNKRGKRSAFSKSRSRMKTSEQSEKSSLYSTILYTFLFIILGWFFYFFLMSDNFEIKTVNITGLKNIPEKDINQIVAQVYSTKSAFFLSNKNIFLFPKDNFKKWVSEKYIVEDMRVDKSFPFSLNIHIEEKLARLVLRVLNKVEIEQLEEGGVISTDETQNNATTTEENMTTAQDKEEEETIIYDTSYFYIDVNGIVVSKEKDISEKDLTTLPVIETRFDSQTLVKPGDIILDREQINYIFSVYEELAKTDLDIKIDYLIYDSNSKKELKVATIESWQIFLNTGINVQTQIKKLELVLSEKIRSTRPSLQYVDLRVQDRVYYK